MQARMVLATRSSARARSDEDVSYHANTLIAVLDQPAALGALRQALAANRIDPEQLSVLDGCRGARSLPEAGSPTRRVRGALDRRTSLSPRNLADGQLLIVIRNLRRDDAGRVRDVLLALGGRDVRHYGHFTVALLAP
jgi:hypothetical protein